MRVPTPPSHPSKLFQTSLPTAHFRLPTSSHDTTANRTSPLSHTMPVSPRRPIKTALNHEVFNSLISCLVATGEQWFVAIDEGVVVLQQSGSNGVDSTSAAAERCIAEAVGHLDLRYEDGGRYGNTVSHVDGLVLVLVVVLGASMSLSTLARVRSQT